MRMASGTVVEACQSYFRRISFAGWILRCGSLQLVSKERCKIIFCFCICRLVAHFDTIHVRSCLTAGENFHEGGILRNRGLGDGTPRHRRLYVHWLTVPFEPSVLVRGIYWEHVQY